MLYDDVDMNAIDSKDIFGVSRIPDATRSSTLLEDNESLTADKSAARKSVPKWDFTSEPKIPAKQSKKNKSDYNASGAGGSFGGDAAMGAGEPKTGTADKRFESAPDFRSRIAVSFQEKLSILEERDRYMRENALKENKNMNSIVVGTCPDMCPEKERLLREINCSFSAFESQIVQSEMLVVPELLVKEYARSSADQDEPLPHELRPEPVLVDTMSHILANIVPRVEDGAVDAGEWYHFCWDRLRSVRKDIVQQQLRSMNIVELLEHSARFHICCAERLIGADRRVFDDKINAENLVNCLQMLLNMYDDLAALDVRCPNESEFRVYMILLLLNSGDCPDLGAVRDVRAAEAARIYFAFKLNLYAEFFKLVKRTSYLNACILQRYFGAVRSHILNVLANAYSSGSQTAKFPLSFVRRVLELDDDDETIAFVEAHGFVVVDVGGAGAPEIRCSKASFSAPDLVPVCRSSYIVRSKRVPLLQAITGSATWKRETRLRKVHTSFDESDALNKEAWRAEDQRRKIIESYGNIYESRDENRYADEPMEAETRGYDRQPPLYSSVFASAVPAASSPAAVSSASSTFTFAISPPMSTFNFGRVPGQSILNFRFNQSPVSTATAAATAAEVGQIKSNVGPTSSSMAAAAFEASSSKLYDPEEEYDSDDVPYAVEAADAKTTASPQNENIAPNQQSSAAKVDNGEPQFGAGPSSQILSPLKKSASASAICVVRRSEEVFDRLSHALNTFKSLYYPEDGETGAASAPDAVPKSPQPPPLDTRKLRKLVRRRLKRGRALKYARLWRKKTQTRKRKRDNFVGVVHLSADEYFRLWGVAGAQRRSAVRNLVAELSEGAKALRWSDALLRGDEAWRVEFAGDELAQRIARQPDAQSRPVVCWKLLASLPEVERDGHRAFVAKVSRLVRTLYCEPGDDRALARVWCRRVAGARVYACADVGCGVAAASSVVGVGCVVAFVCEKWETWSSLRARLLSLCRPTTYPAFVSVVVVGADANCDPYAGRVSALLRKLRKRNLIAGYALAAWQRWSTVHAAVLAACQRPLRSPAFQAHAVSAFVERVGCDLFACLRCARVAGTSPVPFIGAYDECLRAAARIACMRGAGDFNLSPEFVDALVAGDDGGGSGHDGSAKTNFGHPELVEAAVTDFCLVSFTKWPPKSVRKMRTLLVEYCRHLDPSDALLANILRMLDVGDADTVNDICSRAPWLEIVELWFRFRLRSPLSEKYERLYVVYGEAEVKELIERVVIEQINLARSSATTA